MPSVLVVSGASVNAPHRKPYDVLGQEPGWDVHIATTATLSLGDGRSKRADPAPPGAHYALHPLACAAERNARLTWFKGLKGLVARLRPTAIFVEYDPGSVPVLHAYLASRAIGSKIVAFTVENIPRDRWEDMRSHAAKGLLREAVRDAGVALLHAAGKSATDALACINDEGARIFRDDWGFDKTLSVVPLGTDMDLFRPMNGAEVRRKLGLGVDDFVFGYFGRVIEEKGVHLLVDALAQLPARFRLLLDMFKNFAPGSYAASLLERAERVGVAKRITQIDVAHEAVPMYMNACDALVLPSLSTPRWKEQFGRVLPEAMACGVPVVGSDSGNIPCLVGEAGLIVPEGDAEAIGAALRRLANEPELRARLAAEGRARVEAHYSVAVQVAKLKALLA